MVDNLNRSEDVPEVCFDRFKELHVDFRSDRFGISALETVVGIDESGDRQDIPKEVLPLDVLRNLSGLSEMLFIQRTFFRYKTMQNIIGESVGYRAIYRKD